MHAPVIIVGAPRSGTNMLRDVLVQLQNTGTWPCDEINYIWRHGNLRHPSDEFSSEMATPPVQKYIRDRFDQLANNRNLDTVVEKTCANSLRVGFIDKILPEAKYIFFVRDGMDAVSSALERWNASFELMYILRKARYVPIADLPYYASRYLFNHIYRLVSGEKRLAFWGPKMNNTDELLAKHTLTEVCALQWKTCVDIAERDFLSIPSEKIFRIKYEEFVKNPVAIFSQLADFLDKRVPQNIAGYLNAHIRAGSVGKGRQKLGVEKVDRLRPLIADTLNRCGYE